MVPGLPGSINRAQRDPVQTRPVFVCGHKEGFLARLNPSPVFSAMKLICPTCCCLFYQTPELDSGPDRLTDWWCSLTESKSRIVHVKWRCGFVVLQVKTSSLLEILGCFCFYKMSSFTKHLWSSTAKQSILLNNWSRWGLKKNNLKIIDRSVLLVQCNQSLWKRDSKWI